MKIQDIMNRTVKTCSPDTNLAAAATMMWDGDCGVIPVVDENGKVAGLLTDRDICIAVATKGRRADEISVREVISGETHSCSPENNPHEALQIMREHKVRRLPVVDSEGRLQGMLSINDLILEAREGKEKKTHAPAFEDIINTLKAICEHREAVVKAA